MSTDREYLKYQQAGALAGTPAADNVGAVADAHSRQRAVLITSSANAATNVAETTTFVVNRKSKLRAVKLLVPTTNIAQSTSAYDVITVSKRTSAGASQTTVATYNTHNSAQGAVTLQVPASFSVVSNADCIINAGSILTYTITKVGSGQAIDQYSTLDFDLEEV